MGYVAVMAISEQEQQLQAEARAAVLTAIKNSAAKNPNTEQIRNLAEAYALVSSSSPEAGGATGGTLNPLKGRR